MRSAAPWAYFVVGAILFSRGWLGGGDVKLLTAATLWVGPAGTPTLLLLTSVLGGGLALLWLMPGGRQLASPPACCWAFHRSRPSEVWRHRFPTGSRSPVPR